VLCFYLLGRSPHLTNHKNAFAEKLGPLNNFDPYAMLVVDLMHEFELGVWKSTLIHIIRVLHAAAPGGRLVAEFDARYATLCMLMSCNISN
jgi:hypothetical protein